MKLKGIGQSLLILTAGIGMLFIAATVYALVSGDATITVQCIMNNTLNQKASIAIKNLGVEIESEKWWQKVFAGTRGECWEATTHLPQKITIDIGDAFPAPSLSELIAALPEIGEKLGWDKDPYSTDPDTTLTLVLAEAYAQPETTIINDVWQIHAHNLLDTFLTAETTQKGTGMEAVSEEIIKLLAQ